MQNHDHRPLLGLCPIGKFVFSHADAVRLKQELQAALRGWNVRFVDLDAVLPDGMVREQGHVDAVVRHFRQQEIDCLFLPHCNFGTEGAAGMIAHKLQVPTLLWGPRDEAPLADGTRLRDTLCGLFASSKVLHKLGVPFSYIENCRLGEPALAEGVDRFLRAANVANSLRRGLRIGHIGQRIDFFWTTIVNESELLERFGVEILPLDMATFIENVRDRARRGRDGYLAEATQLAAKAEIAGFDNHDPLIRILAVRDQMLALAEAHGLDGLAVQDFNSLMDAMGTYCFFANSMVSDRLPLACESDIHGAISAVLTSRANFDTNPVFITDVTIRHPENDNAVLLWHAGAPLAMKAPDERLRLGHHWILPSPLAGMTHFPLCQGPMTLARFDGDRGDYQLAVGEGRSCAGPDTLNNYVWMQVDDWPRWERLLMQGPFIHHSCMAYGHFGKALIEACQFIPGLTPLPLNTVTWQIARPG